MSSFMTQFSLGHFYKDVPDFLTCGFCAKEFLLENITLFIAHKLGCADKLQHSPDLEDTSSPLTCSVCSQVFMTARGLLHHIQLDHKMKIYLQKGPLLIPNVSSVLPPPAHLFVTKEEHTTVTTTNTTTTCSTMSHDHCSLNQPTDLSLCSQKQTVLSSPVGGEKDGTFKPYDDVSLHEKGSNFASFLPKKRKYLLQDNAKGLHTSSFSSSSLLDSCENTHEDASVTNNDNRVNCEETSSKDLLLECPPKNSPYNPVRSEKDRNAKLKELLQKNSTAEPDHQLGKDSPLVQMSYHLPFTTLKQEPEDLDNYESAAPGVTRDDSCVDTGEVALDIATRSANRFDSGSTTDENTDHDRLTRASSYSPEAIFESYDIETMTQKSLMTEIVRFSSATVSPLHQIDRYSHTQSQVDFSLVNLKLEDLTNSHHSEQSSLYSTQISKQSEPPKSASGQQIGFFAVKSSGANKVSSSRDPHVEMNARPPKSDMTNHNFMSDANLSDSSAHARFQNKNAEVNKHNDLSPSHRFDPHRLSLDDGMDRKFSSQHPSVMRGFEPTMSTFYDGQIVSDKSKNEGSHFNLLGKTSNICVLPTASGQMRKTPILSSHSVTLEESSSHQSTDHMTRMDTDDLQILDAKMMKKRRYPTSRPFKCVHCDQAFNQRIHLKKHMSKHTGVKPFKCQQCDYSTVERSHLKVHYRIHTGEKPYRCLFCDYATAQNSTLKIHLKRHHEGINSDISSSRGRELYLPHGIRDEEEADKYVFGLSKDSEGVAVNKLTSLRQDYSCTFSDKGGRSDIITSDHCPLDSIVGNFSFVSKSKNNMYPYTQSKLMTQQLTNHLPHLTHTSFDSKCNMQSNISATDQGDSSRFYLPKSQQCEMSVSADNRQMIQYPLNESVVSERKVSSKSDHSTLKDLNDDIIYQNKKETSEKISSNESIKIQTTQGKDTQVAQEMKYSINQGKEFSSPSVKNYMTTSNNGYHMGKDFSKSLIKECHLTENYVKESQNVYHIQPNISKLNSETEYKMKDKTKNESDNSGSVLDLTLKDLNREQRVNFVQHKSEQILNQESFDDDDSDLDYNAGLPIVNIPNKEFVRG